MTITCLDTHGGGRSRHGVPDFTIAPPIIAVEGHGNGEPLLPCPSRPGTHGIAPDRRRRQPDLYSILHMVLQHTPTTVTPSSPCTVVSATCDQRHYWHSAANCSRRLSRFLEFEPFEIIAPCCTRSLRAPALAWVRDSDGVAGHAPGFHPKHHECLRDKA